MPEEAVFAHLLAIERSGSRTPLFCVHGAGGHGVKRGGACDTNTYMHDNRAGCTW